MQEIFKNFIKEKEVSENIFNKYNSCLPSDLMKVWKEYGFGSLMNGYLKIVNPDEYQELLNDTYFRGNVSIPIFVTAFGDIITFEENRYIRIIKYKNGIFDILGAGFDFFLEDLEAGVFNDRFFDISKYNEAIANLGKPTYDECFGYTPLLGLGGSEKVENLKKVKIKEHIEIISQLVGGIGMEF